MGGGDERAADQAAVEAVHLALNNMIMDIDISNQVNSLSLAKKIKPL